MMLLTRWNAKTTWYHAGRLIVVLPVVHKMGKQILLKHVLCSSFGQQLLSPSQTAAHCAIVVQ